jgi:hypothetical protein
MVNHDFEFGSGQGRRVTATHWTTGDAKQKSILAALSEQSCYATAEIANFVICHCPGPATDGVASPPPYAGLSGSLSWLPRCWWGCPAESEFLNAESELLIAESELLIAESELLIAESELLIAESEHLIAESEHLIAESEHLIADAKFLMQREVTTPPESPTRFALPPRK